MAMVVYSDKLIFNVLILSVLIFSGKMHLVGGDDVKALCMRILLTFIVTVYDCILDSHELADVTTPILPER
jgi:hypothetical protein